MKKPTDKLSDEQSRQVRAEIKILQANEPLRRALDRITALVKCLKSEPRSRAQEELRAMVRELDEFSIRYGELAEIISGKKLPRRKRR
jgi:hypothetical protein